MDTLSQVGLREESLTKFAGRLPRPLINRVKRVIAAPVAWNLNALAVIWGTDKARGQHGYTNHYTRLIKRRSVRCMLEIGIGGYEDPTVGGSSLLMWRNYFPKATVYGLDIHEKRVNAPRIIVLQGDQSDPESLERAVAHCPPFDLIIDDGSHIASHTLTTFETLFPKLRPGGVYAIEDLHTSYATDFGGGPPGAPGTALELIKTLVDRVQPESGVHDLADLHVFDNLVIIRKAVY